MKKWAVAASVLVLIVSFQNCSNQGRVGLAPEAQSASIHFNKYSTEGADHLVMWDSTGQQFIDLDLSTGKMIPVEKYGDQPISNDTYCLSSTELTQVKDLIAASEICEPVGVVEPAPGTMCTQVYTYPYAILASVDAEVRLGEKTDGCSQPTDLCGVKADELKTFVANTLSSLSQRICH